MAMLTITLLACVFPIIALGANTHIGSTRAHHNLVARNISARAFRIADMYQGQSFLNDWDFFSNDDPTHGNVIYQTKEQAKSKGLAFVQADGTTVLAVDDKSQVPAGGKRASVRISSKKKYNSGLFIADFFSMPHGCSVWPAYWSVGPKWPEGGEIDIIEGVNLQTTNQYTLHTGSGCTIDKGRATPLVSGKILGTQCASTQTSNNGCAFLDSDARSFGHGFNTEGGGVFAHLWDSTGIKIWHFARSEIPADITAKDPNPSNWPPPAALWSSQSCNTGKLFTDHVLTLDTTICGDWAGAAYGSSGCPGTCAQAIADPANFKHAKWNINYIAVYN